MTTFGVQSAQGTTPLVIAHRGASHAETENTLAAFGRAGELGADGVELDARLSADGIVVVHHDAALDDGRHIGALALAALPEHVPTLADALALCDERHLAVNIEIKVEDPEPGGWAELATAVVAQLRARPGDHLVTSFSAACIEGVRAMAPELETGILGFGQPDAATFVLDAVRAGHQTINPWDGVVDATLVGAAHDAGLAIHVWTVDEPDRMAQLAALGVDGIITNRPDVLRSVLTAALPETP